MKANTPNVMHKCWIVCVCDKYDSFVAEGPAEWGLLGGV